MAAVRELLRHSIASAGAVRCKCWGLNLKATGSSRHPKEPEIAERLIRSKARQSGFVFPGHNCQGTTMNSSRSTIGRSMEAAYLTERVSDEHLAKLLTLSYEPMLAWRLDGLIAFWNAGAERLYGFSPSEAIGQSSHALLQTKFPLPLLEVSSQLRDTGQSYGVLRHTCKDGREVVVESRMQLLVDTVLEVNRDITDRTQFEIAL